MTTIDDVASYISTMCAECGTWGGVGQQTCSGCEARRARFDRLVEYHRDEAAVVALDRWERNHGHPASHAGFYAVRARVVSKVLDAAGLEGPPTHWGGVVVDPSVVGQAVARVARKYRALLGELGITVRADVDRNPIAVVTAILSRMGLSAREKKKGGHRSYVVAKGDVAKMEEASARYLGRILDRDPAGKLFRDPVLAELEVEWDRDLCVPMKERDAELLMADLAA